MATLDAVYASGPSTTTQIAQFARSTLGSPEVTPRRVSPIVKRLERLGLLTDAPADGRGDGRMVFYGEPEGRELQAEFAAFSRFRDGVTPLVGFLARRPGEELGMYLEQLRLRVGAEGGYAFAPRALLTSFPVASLRRIDAAFRVTRERLRALQGAERAAEASFGIECATYFDESVTPPLYEALRQTMPHAVKLVRPQRRVPLRTLADLDGVEADLLRYPLVELDRLLAEPDRELPREWGLLKLAPPIVRTFFLSRAAGEVEHVVFVEGDPLAPYLVQTLRRLGLRVGNAEFAAVAYDDVVDLAKRWAGLNVVFAVEPHLATVFRRHVGPAYESLGALVDPGATLARVSKLEGHLGDSVHSLMHVLVAPLRQVHEPAFLDRRTAAHLGRGLGAPLPRGIDPRVAVHRANLRPPHVLEEGVGSADARLLLEPTPAG